MANEDIERLGFEVVARYELARGREVVPGMGGRGEGYDLASLEPDGRIRLIEVKATTKKRPPFRWLEAKEYQRMEMEENYWVYVVRSVDSDPHVRAYSKQEFSKRPFKEEIKRCYSFRAADFISEEKA